MPAGFLCVRPVGDQARVWVWSGAGRSRPGQSGFGPGQCWADRFGSPVRFVGSVLPVRFSRFNSASLVRFGLEGTVQINMHSPDC